MFLGGAFNLFAADHDFFFPVGRLGQSTLRLGALGIDESAGDRWHIDVRRAHA